MRRIGGSQLYVLGGGKRLGQIFELDDGYDAVAYEYRGNWHLLTIPELAEIRRELTPGRDPEGVLGSRGKVVTIAVGRKPSRPAVVLDAAGEVSGAWLAGSAAKKRAKLDPAPLRGRPRRRREVPGPDATLGRATFSTGAGVGSGSRPRIVEGGGSGGSTSGAPPEGGGPDGPGPEVETVRRTPHLDAPETITKKPGTELTVSVYVDSNELRAGESGEGIELDLPPDIDSIEVGVVLQLTGPFELAEGSEFRQLTIERDEEESAKLEFKLRVTSSEDPGPAAISALFTLRGRSCGYVARAWDWSAEGDTAPCRDADAEAPVSMPLHIGAEQPSLSIFITAPIKDGVHYQCSVQAPALVGYEEPSPSEEFAVPADGYKFMETLLEALTDEGATSDERFRSLLVVGQQAWEAAPQIVQDVLWRMVDQGVPPTTINIASVEPVLAWELMIPQRFDGREPDELGPLGVEFAIGRWTRTDSQAPSPRLQIDRSFVVAPNYSEPRQLDFENELKLIEKELCGQRVEPATFDGLDQRFGEDHASLLHFVCHGDAGVKNDDEITLEDKKLRASILKTLEGFKALCRDKHPLVFLNSCSTGKIVHSLAGGAGFPRSFGDLGANAIIAPLWPVVDELASKMAVELYEEAVKPGAKPIPEILRGIRRRGYEEQDADTYAAYCFFGDAEARLELLDCSGQLPTVGGDDGQSGLAP